MSELVWIQKNVQLVSEGVHTHRVLHRLLGSQSIFYIQGAHRVRDHFKKLKYLYLKESIKIIRKINIPCFNKHFLWGRVKSIVYASKRRLLEDLKAKITCAFRRYCKCFYCKLSNLITLSTTDDVGRVGDLKNTIKKLFVFLSNYFNIFLFHKY